MSELIRTKAIRQRLAMALAQWTDAYLDYLEKPNAVVTTSEIAVRVRTLSLAVLALNGVDVYDCSEECHE